MCRTRRRRARRRCNTHTRHTPFHSSEAPPAPPDVLDQGLADPLDEAAEDPEQRVHGDPGRGGDRAPPLRRHDAVLVQPVHHVLGAPGVEAVPARQAPVHGVPRRPAGPPRRRRPPAHLAHEARLRSVLRRQLQRVLVRRRELHPPRHRRAARVHVEPARRAPEREALHRLAADVALAPEKPT